MTDPLPPAERCECGHDWNDHDGMGDCGHLDGRTVTGYCQRCGSTDD